MQAVIQLSCFTGVYICSMLNWEEHLTCRVVKSSAFLVFDLAEYLVNMLFDVLIKLFKPHILHLDL